MKNVCTIKTIDDLIKELEEAKKKLGGDAAVIMSQDEEGNAYGDILMFETDTVDGILGDEWCEYRGCGEDSAVKEENQNKNVLIIFPNL